LVFAAAFRAISRGRSGVMFAARAGLPLRPFADAAGRGVKYRAQRARAASAWRSTFCQRKAAIAWASLGAPSARYAARSNSARWASDNELHVASPGQEFVSNIGDQAVPREWLRAVRAAIEAAMTGSWQCKLCFSAHKNLHRSTKLRHSANYREHSHSKQCDL
jgi:hypothetical protein